MAKSYGAHREGESVCARALFVLDRNGVIFSSYCWSIAVNPGADGILKPLENCQRRIARTIFWARPTHR